MAFCSFQSIHVIQLIDNSFNSLIYLLFEELHGGDALGGGEGSAGGAVLVAERVDDFDQTGVVTARQQCVLADNARQRCHVEHVDGVVQFGRRHVHRDVRPSLIIYSLLIN